MSKWLCLKCEQEDGVVSGMCRRCGVTKTNPLDAAAKLEAGVDAAAKSKVDDEQASIEAEERNQASIEAGGEVVDAGKL